MMVTVAELSPIRTSGLELVMKTVNVSSFSREKSLCSSTVVHTDSPLDTWGWKVIVLGIAT